MTNYTDSKTVLELIERIQHLDNELTRLHVALEDMEAEKERCRKLAVENALKADGYRHSLELCENMKLAHEFEDLLQTTSIPVAVEKVRGLIAINAQIDSLLDNWQAWSTCVAPDEMIQEYWRRLVDSMINLAAVKGASK
jgi:spore coat polysaccharide biosynthesis protein SpsF (cytidylyltransferase family)